MKYSAVQSLLDLEVGKVYFKSGSSYLVIEKTEDKVVFRVDGTEDEVIELKRETFEKYLDSIFKDEDEIFFKLKRDEE